MPVAKHVLGILTETGEAVLFVMFLIPYALFWIIYSLVNRESPFEEWDNPGDD